MKLLIVEDDRALNDGIALSLKADADTFWRGSMNEVGGALSREFAMFQSMGMTRRQLSQMLMAAD